MLESVTSNYRGWVVHPESKKWALVGLQVNIFLAIVGYRKTNSSGVQCRQRTVIVWVNLLAVRAFSVLQVKIRLARIDGYNFVE